MLRKRHIDVLRWAAMDYTVAETASELGITVDMVKRRRSEAIHLLGATTITGAVIEALIKGYIVISSHGCTAAERNEHADE